MVMRPPTRPSTTTLSPLSVHRCVESDSERASDLTHEASSHAAPRHATCCRHSRTSGSDGRRVAESDRTPHAALGDVLLGRARLGWCVRPVQCTCCPCGACVRSEPLPFQSGITSGTAPATTGLRRCGGAWCHLGDGVLVSAAFFCGVRGRLLALHPPKCSTSGPPAPRHVHETTTRHGETARDRELGVGVSARADPSDRANCACSGSVCGGGGRVHHTTRRGLRARARLRRWQR